MAKVYVSVNNGNSGRKVNKDVETHSHNVSPNQLIAVAAPGLAFPIGELQNYDYFTADYAVGTTNEISLPVALPIGTKITIHAIRALEVSSVASSGIGINGGADTTEVAITVGGTMTLTKVSATNWTAINVAANGAVTSPSPA